MLDLSARRGALNALAIVSFLESSVFPIPPDVMLVPMVLADRTRAFRLAAVCSLASVLGGVAGYALGYFFFETVGEWIVRTYSLGPALEAFREGFDRWGVWIILVKGLTPIPYKLVTIASGAAQFDLFTFVWASVLTRGARFYLLAALLWRYGEPIRGFVERRLVVLTWGVLIALVAGVAALRLFG